MLALIPLSFMLGAVGYAALAVWRASIAGFRGTALLLSAGFAGMALWNVVALLGGPGGAVLAEIIRNIMWIAYLVAIVRRDDAAPPQRWLGALPYWLVGLAMVRACLVVGVALAALPVGDAGAAAAGVSLAFCIGALVLVQNLYFATHRAASGFKLILFALAVLWAYDLNLYATVLLRFDVPMLLAEGRGVVALALAPLFAIAARRKERWTILLSRRMAFQSLSLVAIGGYLVLAATVAGARPWLNGRAYAVGEVVLLASGSAAALAMLLSPRLRAVVKVFLTKHLFEHRYDYRAEWLRFNATINSGAMVGLSAEQRAVKALVDLMAASGGALYLREGRNRLARAAAFERSGDAPAATEIGLSPELIERVETRTHVLIAARYGGDDDDAAAMPPEFAVADDVWLVVPLVRTSSLVGLVALSRADVPRQLDWEDFDLLKVLGQQIATYLADALSQAELEEARQFEEFNRRFAFIVHDIKNVVSQLSLVAANAAEHGANPKFQAAMVSTLQNSAGKMATLLTRLSPQSAGADIAMQRVPVAPLLNEIALSRGAQHAIAVEADPDLAVMADRARLMTALDHLVQNAIEASDADVPVRLSAVRSGGDGVIAVRDDGAGMSADFIRRRLFKPFASTKEAGFGIGAGEARTLVRQMGGALEVQSVEGAGSCFAIALPAADG